MLEARRGPIPCLATGHGTLRKDRLPLGALVIEPSRDNTDMDAQSVIQYLSMNQHPEGGWYVETYRASAEDGARGAMTAIYFLLTKGQRSHWHQVDAAEAWLWHAGAPLRLRVSADGAATDEIVLGPELSEGQHPQAVVPAHAWQSAESLGAWTLVSCVVAPAFHFEGFRISAPGWEPGRNALNK